MACLRQGPNLRRLLCKSDGRDAQTPLGVNVPSAPTHHPLHPLSQVTSQVTHTTSHHQSHVGRKIQFISGDVLNVKPTSVSTKGMKLQFAPELNQMILDLII